MKVDAVIIRRSPVVTMFRLVGFLILLALAWVTLIFIVRSMYNGSAADIFQLDIMLLILYAVVAIFASLFVMLRWSFEEYFVHENEVVHLRGVIFRHENHISLKNVATISVDQKFFGRILKFGTIVIHSPLIRIDIQLKNVSDPMMQVPILESAAGKKQDDVVPFRDQ
jgi:uncharacterized membrane protein YdbT with pleckstrin-like domain